jgi:predicted metal-dependent HD superfamily phosphohydrolase
VLDRWLPLVAGAPSRLAESAGRDLLDRYAEPQRRYHDNRHLAEVLDAVDRLAEHADDLTAVRLAAWFHDAVYEPAAGPGANEEASARLATDVLTRLEQPADRVAAVAALVRATAQHEPASAAASGGSSPADAAVLFDADLAIPRYDEYAADVRAEYAHVREAAFRSGRAAILREFAGRPRIYLTSTAHELWEAAARANLAAEIAALEPAG